MLGFLDSPDLLNGRIIMIRQVLTTLFCSVTFFLIAFVIPVRAEHPFTTNFVCLTEEAGMVPYAYQRPTPWTN